MSVNKPVARVAADTGRQVVAVSLALIGIVIADGTLHGQTVEPAVRISITGGALTGVGEAWRVGTIPVIVQKIVLPARPPRWAQASCPADSRGYCRLLGPLLGPPPSCVRTRCEVPQELWDTLGVRQFIGGGPTVNVSVSGRLSGRLKIGGTFALNLLASDKECTMEFVSVGADTVNLLGPETNPNVSNCATVNKQDGVFGVFDLMPFLEVDISHEVYLRLNAGVSTIPNTTTMRTQFRSFVDTDGGSSIRPAFQVSLGLEPRTSGGRVRMEIGVKRHRFDVVTAVGPDANAALSSVWHNQATFQIGFSFALED